MSIASKRYDEWRTHGYAQNMNERDIEDAFYRDLEFGTGGLRGKIGEGTNRMNYLTVGRATLGLASYICKRGDNKTVAIAYDSRLFSKEFAHRAAEIFSSFGIKVKIFSELMPTPVLSYAIRKIGADAGIVITASHNPKAYNGYKVYNEKGCQITDDAAAEITSEIEKYGYFTEFEKREELITYFDDELLEDFLADVMKHSVRNVDYSNIKMVYSPLNGTGRVPVKKLYEKMGFGGVTVVKEQEMPDGNFTTCPYPNPEEESALTLAYELMRSECAELMIATDPDADRVGVAEQDGSGNIRRFSGNEIGLILLEYILKAKAEKGELNDNQYAVKTIVTSDIGRKIANNYGLKCVDVLTGFKYIGETIDRLSSEEYVFGFEESCGYLIGDYARDKDAIGAVMLVTEAKAYYKSLGLTLCDVIEGIYKKYGYTETLLCSKQFDGPSGADEKNALIASIRENPYTHIDGKKVTSFKDYSKGLNGLPKSDVMEFSGDGFKVIVRPSGTEPKLKTYIFADGKSSIEAKRAVVAIKNSLNEIC